MKIKTVLLAIALIAGLAGCDRHPASSAPQKPVIPVGELGSHLPVFDVRDLQGNNVSSQNLQGKVVLIDIWATWCQPCRKEMPGYQTLLDKYGARGFAVVGQKPNVMRDTEDPVKFAKQIGVR